MTVGERIKRLRENFGLTANEFAEITGIHPVSIRKYETNKMIPGIDVIDKMCAALKLPRMIFEGFPEQYTDYSFLGDFYQQIFLLMANNTISVLEEDNKSLIKINPDFLKHLHITHDGKELSPSDLEISIHPNGNSFSPLDPSLSIYLFMLGQIQDAKNMKTWNNKSAGETREECINRLTELAEERRFDMMLAEHSWHQYMKGWVSADEANKAINEEINAGGDYYSYVDKLDAPEKEKERLIHSYENAYIIELIQSDEGYSDNKNSTDKYSRFEKKSSLIKQFKEEHPDYPELARTHAAENARKIREEITNK